MHRTVPVAALGAVLSLSAAACDSQGRTAGAPIPDPCPEAVALAGTRAREAEAAHAAWLAVPGPTSSRHDFHAEQRVNTRQRLVYAVSRYAAVVEQNQPCFSVAERADAEALKRTWAPG